MKVAGLGTLEITARLQGHERFSLEAPGPCDSSLRRCKTCLPSTKAGLSCNRGQPVACVIPGMSRKRNEPTGDPIIERKDTLAKTVTAPSRTGWNANPRATTADTRMTGEVFTSRLRIGENVLPYPP